MVFAPLAMADQLLVAKKLNRNLAADVRTYSLIELRSEINVELNGLTVSAGEIFNIKLPSKDPSHISNYQWVSDDSEANSAYSISQEFELTGPSWGYEIFTLVASHESGSQGKVEL